MVPPGVSSGKATEGDGELSPKGEFDGDGDADGVGDADGEGTAPLRSDSVLSWLHPTNPFAMINKEKAP